MNETPLSKIARRDRNRYRAEVAAGMTGLIFLAPFVVIIGIVIWAAVS